MGVDAHAFKFLRYAAQRRPLGDVATLGRQNLYVSASDLQKVFSIPPGTVYGPYCESLFLEQFGATDVTSFDNSDYEKATVLHDMNKPLTYSRAFDTVLDFGTLEHVFNISVALANTAALCRPGGQILHVLPGNNFSGHGFWQVSPELFFSLYSEANGFVDTEVYVAELDDTVNWWRASRPDNGIRIEHTSSSRCYVMAITSRRDEATSQRVQQSDYLTHWDSGAPPMETQANPALRKTIHAAIKRIPAFWRFADILVPLTDKHVDVACHRLAPDNRHFSKVPVASLIGPSLTKVGHMTIR